MGAIADAVYIQLMNQVRREQDLVPDPNGVRLLPAKCPTKWAVLQVLSRNCWLSTRYVKLLLDELGYPRSRTMLNMVLNRCVRFGFVERSTFYREEGRLKSKERHRHTKWKLTARGLETLTSTAPKKIMRESVSELIRGLMSRAERWLTLEDLQTRLLQQGRKVSRQSISRALSLEGAPFRNTNMTLLSNDDTTTPTYQWMYVPNDPTKHKQWALTFSDVSSWENAPFKTKTKKSRSMDIPIIRPPTFQGITMCLPESVINKFSLIGAVGDLVVNEFVPAMKSFTAHDVTDRLRERVLTNESIVDPLEVGTVHVKGKKVPRIQHEDVRHIVHELFHMGTLRGYERVHDGEHFNYVTTARVLPEPPQPAPVPSEPVAAQIDSSIYDN